MMSSLKRVGPGGGEVGDVPQKRFRRAHKKGNLQQQVVRLRRQLGAFKPEVKYFATTVFPTNLFTTTLNYISSIKQGDDVADRIGDKIRALWIECNITMTSVPASNAVATYVGHLVRDRESGGASPTISGSGNAVQIGNQPTSSMVNTTTRRRFKYVHKDQWSANATLLGNETVMKSWIEPLNFVMTFHDTSAANTAAGQNALYYIMCGDDGIGTVDFQATFVIAYTDA